MTDQEIYEGIARKDNQTFLYLYETYKDRIIGMVKKNSGNEDDALDIFQEGLIALWTNIQQGKFQIQESARISTYLYALCRNHWISRIRKRKDVQSIEQNPVLQIADEDVTDLEETYEQTRQLENFFRKLGASCQKILQLFYYQKASLKEIAIQMEITEKTAKNTKYRCMKNLRAIYQSESQLS